MPPINIPDRYIINKKKYLLAPLNIIVTAYNNLFHLLLSKQYTSQKNLIILYISLLQILSNVIYYTNGIRCVKK